MGFFSSNNDSEYKVGDKVRVKYRGQEGYIIDKNDNLYMVSLDDGRYVDSYTADQLEKCW
jgi:ribosomal protein L21E